MYCQRCDIYCQCQQPLPPSYTARSYPVQYQPFMPFSDFPLPLPVPYNPLMPVIYPQNGPPYQPPMSPPHEVPYQHFKPKFHDSPQAQSSNVSYVPLRPNHTFYQNPPPYQAQTPTEAWKRDHGFAWPVEELDDNQKYPENEEVGRSRYLKCDVTLTATSVIPVAFFEDKFRSCGTFVDCKFVKDRRWNVFIKSTESTQNIKNQNSHGMIIHDVRNVENILVTKLSYSVMVKDLRELLKPYGCVEDCYIFETVGYMRVTPKTTVAEVIAGLDGRKVFDEIIKFNVSNQEFQIPLRGIGQLKCEQCGLAHQSSVCSRVKNVPEENQLNPHIPIINLEISNVPANQMVLHLKRLTGEFGSVWQCYIIRDIAYVQLSTLVTKYYILEKLNSKTWEDGTPVKVEVIDDLPVNNDVLEGLRCDLCGLTTHSSEKCRRSK